MSIPRDSLIEGFSALEPSATDEAACPPAEEIWDAVHGKLSRERTREIIDLVVTNPAVAEVWRLASRLGADGAEPAVGSVLRGRSRGPRWLAVAAALLLGVVGLWQLKIQTTPVATTRERASAAIQSLLANDERLPRADFQLRWTTESAGARYDVRVLTETLEPVAEAFDLTTGEFRVDPTHLIRLDDGSRLLWQVVEYRMTGEQTYSETFSVILAEVGSAP